MATTGRGGPGLQAPISFCNTAANDLRHSGQPFAHEPHEQDGAIRTTCLGCPRRELVDLAFRPNPLRRQRGRTKFNSPGAQGYEIDFLSTEALDLHVAQTAAKVPRMLGLWPAER